MIWSAKVAYPMSRRRLAFSTQSDYKSQVSTSVMVLLEAGRK
jgi:hypothetical protein